MKITIENIDVKKAAEILMQIDTRIAPTILVEVEKFITQKAENNLVA